MGRFITADPTIQHPYDPQDFNRYAYARNNPVKYIDPTGYGFWSWVKSFFKKFGGTIASVAFTMVGLPIVGAVVGATINTIANHGNFLDFGISLGVGIAAGFAGGSIAGAVARSFGMNLAGIETALLRGGLSGALGGMGAAAVYEGDIGKGAWQGALAGMAVSSAVWTKNSVVTEKFLNENVKWDKSMTKTEKTQLVQSIKEAGQSPLGQRLFMKFVASGEKLTLTPYHGPNSFVYTGTNTVHINPNIETIRNIPAPKYNQLHTMDLSTLLLHETGHTLTGGDLRDPLNVAYHENTYRGWIGRPLRSGYYKQGDIPFRWGHIGIWR